MPVPPLPVSRPIPQRPLHTSSQHNRVFICDDDLEFASEVASALVAGGFDVRTLLDGKSPVEIFELFQPDIVFLDIFMPPPDGFEILNYISQDTRQKPLTLTLISGADGALLDVAASFCHARGIKSAGILQKPLRLGKILEICRSHSPKM